MPRYAEGGATGGGGSDKGFCSKPTRGWLHTDQTILNEGVTFNVRVIKTKMLYVLLITADFNTSSVYRMSRNSNLNEGLRFCAAITCG